MSSTLQVRWHIEGRQLKPQLRSCRRCSHLDRMSVWHTFSSHANFRLSQYRALGRGIFVWRHPFHANLVAAAAAGETRTAQSQAPWWQCAAVQGMASCLLAPSEQYPLVQMPPAERAPPRAAQPALPPAPKPVQQHCRPLAAQMHCVRGMQCRVS
jgi:hypothetical protein